MEHSKIKIFDIIKTTSLTDLRKQVDKQAEKGSVIVQGDSIEFNRKVLENNKVDMLLSPEVGKKKIGFKERDSGLNQVLCKIAKKNNIIIGIDFSEILRNRGKNLALYLGRLMQNIKLCKKYKVDMILVNKKGRDNYDLRALLTSLGMSTSMAKKAVEKNIS